MKTELFTTKKEKKPFQKNSQKGRIYHLLKKEKKGLTRKQISKKLNIKLTNVCGRTDELIHQGFLYDLREKKPAKVHAY